MKRLLLLCACALALRADIVTCACDPARPETLQARQCSLCREAEKQPPEVQTFFLKDINPTKPNRWLALPRAYYRTFDKMPPAERKAFWTSAVAKAKSLFPSDWALAYNAPQVQTQCHLHVHLGKLIPGVETPDFFTIDSIDQLPLPAKGEGYWIHPQGGRLHVHTGEQITETVLLR